MKIVISEKVEEKLKEKHNVVRSEVEQCFENIFSNQNSPKLVEDVRPQHRTTPPTEWFISCTNKGRELLVVFMQMNGEFHIKSAFEPIEKEKWVYANR